MKILKLNQPLKASSKMIGLFLKPELYEYIQRISDSENSSKNYMINEIIEEHIKTSK